MDSPGYRNPCPETMPLERLLKRQPHKSGGIPVRGDADSPCYLNQYLPAGRRPGEIRARHDLRRRENRFG